MFFQPVSLITLLLQLALIQKLTCSVPLLPSKGHNLGPRGSRTMVNVKRKLNKIYLKRLKNKFAMSGASWPPTSLTILAFKDEKRLEVWSQTHGQQKFIKSYRIFAASGNAGPKLQRGDYQVPEGFYRILYHNPNSNFHLSMKVNYPNNFDRMRAKAERRSDLGGDIFIHGSNVSAGCLAMGNGAIEELFLLTSLSNRTEVLISPRDFRSRSLTSEELNDKWLRILYSNLDRHLSKYTKD